MLSCISTRAFRLPAAEAVLLLQPGLPWVLGSPWVWVWVGYVDDLPSPQTHGDSMGIFNQPEITR